MKPRWIRCAQWLVLLILLSSCSTQRHGSKAHLFGVTQSGSGADSRLHLNRERDPELNLDYAMNVVFVSTDSKFSVELQRVNPGLLLFKPERLQSRANGGVTREQRNNLQAKELWMLTTIQSLDPADPLELKSKRYFKSSVLHLDAHEGALIPIDDSERLLFTHESDASYRVSMRIFEVDRIMLKQEIARAVNDPGIAGILKAAGQTAASTFGAVAGNYVTSRFRQLQSEPLAMERLLLTSGATEEFVGGFVIVRRSSFNQNSGLKEQLNKEYAFVDLYKGDAGTDWQSPDARRDAIESLRRSRLCLLPNEATARLGYCPERADGGFPTDLGRAGFLQFRVSEIANPTKAGVAGSYAVSANEVALRLEEARKALSEASTKLVQKGVLDAAIDSARKTAARERERQAQNAPVAQISGNAGSSQIGEIEAVAKALQRVVQRFQQLEKSKATDGNGDVKTKLLLNEMQRTQLEIVALTEKLLQRFSGRSCEELVAGAEFCRAVNDVRLVVSELREQEALQELIQRPND